MRNHPAFFVFVEAADVLIGNVYPLGEMLRNQQTKLNGDYTITKGEVFGSHKTATRRTYKVLL